MATLELSIVEIDTSSVQLHNLELDDLSIYDLCRLKNLLGHEINTIKRQLGRFDDPNVDGYSRDWVLRTKAALDAREVNLDTLVTYMKSIQKEA